MGIVSSGVKALTKGGAKKAPKAAAKKAAPKAAPKPRLKGNYPVSKGYKWDAADYGMAAVGPVAGMATAKTYVDTRNKQDKEYLRKKARSGLAKGADKFGSTGRR